MCRECGCYPCKSNCPNAPEPEPVYICDEGGYGIYDGEPYYSLGGKHYCEGCIDTCRYTAYMPDPFEPDPMDIWKSWVEDEMCRGE